MDFWERIKIAVKEKVNAAGKCMNNVFPKGPKRESSRWKENVEIFRNRLIRGQRGS